MCHRELTEKQGWAKKMQRQHGGKWALESQRPGHDGTHRYVPKVKSKKKKKTNEVVYKGGSKVEIWT